MACFVIVCHDCLHQSRLRLCRSPGKCVTCDRLSQAPQRRAGGSCEGPCSILQHCICRILQMIPVWSFLEDSHYRSLQYLFHPVSMHIMHLEWILVGCVVACHAKTVSRSINYIDIYWHLKVMCHTLMAHMFIRLEVHELVSSKADELQNITRAFYKEYLKQVALWTLHMNAYIYIIIYNYIYIYTELYWCEET